MPYDVLTLGEAMLRLSPSGSERLEESLTLSAAVGGSESNMAVALARLGLSVAWLSRLTENPLGQHIANTLRAHGVDTRHIHWTTEDRVGLYFLEEGAAPRQSQVIYDRKNSAMSRMQPEHLPRDLFQPGVSRLFHLSGITLALGTATYATAIQAMDWALAASWQLSFDVNYRSRLWSLAEAQQGCEPFLHSAHRIFMPIRDARALYALPADSPLETVLDHLSARYPQAQIILTLGAEGAAVRTPTGETFTQAAYPAAAVSRLGRGDAFVAGYLYADLTGHPIPTALQYGCALAALKYSMSGDMALTSRSEVEAVIHTQGITGIQR
jgi:2-dehydro-3-deoxygluconokinase